MSELATIITEDGSHTLFSKRFNQVYHSRFGAIQESQRVFIDLGFKHAVEKFGEIEIFEMGFGTGLNALMTAQLAEKYSVKVNYTAIEAYPVMSDISELLNYDGLLHSKNLQQLHQAAWGEATSINPYFSLFKINGTLEALQIENPVFNLIYFDAFAPETQPELWTREIFEKVAQMTTKGGILCTYCSKGYVQRNLRAAGFSVEKHRGPVGKREVIQAILL